MGIMGRGHVRRLGAGKTDYNLEYHGYSDSDYAGDVSTRKSTSACVFFIAGGSVSWKSSKQHAVTLSSTEAEYYLKPIVLLRQKSYSINLRINVFNSYHRYKLAKLNMYNF